MDFIPLMRSLCKELWNAYCAFAPGGVAPIEGLLAHFEDDLQAHIRLGKCPYAETDH
jgi:NADH-quinone oxidoreductase subunit F